MTTQIKAQYTTNTVNIYLGSAVKVICCITSFSKDQNGISKEDNEYIALDYINALSPEYKDAYGTIPSEIPNEHFVPAVIKDQATLEKADRQGLLTAVDAIWVKNPGATKDEKGACANPRIGNALMGLNTNEFIRKLINCIQRMVSHVRKQQQAQKGIKNSNERTQVILRIHLSTVGGTASGATPRLLEEILPFCKQQAGVDIKVVLAVLAKGNLDTQKLEKAEINTLTTLKYLHAKTANTYINLVTGKKMPVPFDRIDMYSNQNKNGNLTDLNAFLLHQATLEYCLHHTPAGIQAQERLVDNEIWDTDEYQDPQCVYTGSIAPFVRDSNRSIEYCCWQSIALFVKSCLQEGDLKKILNDAAAQVRVMKINETEEGNQLSRDILTLDEYAGESVIERNLAGFTDRIDGTVGIERIESIEQVLQIIMGDLDSLYGPLMRQQAQKRLQTTTTHMDRYLRILLRSFNGIWQSLKTLEFIKSAIQGSLETCSEKINETALVIAENEEKMAESLAEIDEIKSSNFFIRMLRRFRIQSITEFIEQIARDQIRFQYDLQSYAIAQEEVLRPLLNCVENLVQAHAVKLQALQILRQEAINTSIALTEKPTLLNVQTGTYLTALAYLKDYFSGLVTQHKGNNAFIAFLGGLFLEQYQSFAVLMNVSKAELTNMLKALFTQYLEPFVRSTSAMDEFRKFPEHIQKDILKQMILSSEGRLLTEGQGHENIEWVQVASVPSEEDIEYMKDLLSRIDAKPGKWHIIVQKDNDTFSLIQLRGQITLSQFIKRLELVDSPESWKKLIDAAVDPVSAIMPSPQPTSRQSKRLLAKAAACGLLKPSASGFCYTDSKGKVVSLPEDNDELSNAFYGQFREIVFIETTFAHKLLVQQKQTIDALQSLLQGKDYPFISDDSVRECLIQAELLLPRIQRYEVLLEKSRHEES